MSDRNVVKLSDAKTLDMRDEHWQLIEDLLPVLRPLEIATSLFSAEETPSAAAVYPTVWKLVTHDMAVTEDDSSGVISFKVCNI